MDGQINQNGTENQINMNDIKQRINELSEAIEAFNYASSSLRDVLRSAIPLLFHVDPLMHVTLSFEEPIAVDELIATEIFGKHYIEITAIRLIDQQVQFVFNTEDGEDTLEYTMGIYDNMKEIELWQYYLLSLIAPAIVPLIKRKAEEMNNLTVLLRETVKMDKKGEDNE